jgi:hypothetical protein
MINPRIEKTWVGDPPASCDVCGKRITVAFVDGVTQSSHGGSWACMCLGCHSRVGVGLGTGKGQQYELLINPVRWVKVQG